MTRSRAQRAKAAAKRRAEALQASQRPAQPGQNSFKPQTNAQKRHARRARKRAKERAEKNAARDAFAEVSFQERSKRPMECGMCGAQQPFPKESGLYPCTNNWCGGFFEIDFDEMKSDLRDQF